VNGSVATGLRWTLAGDLLARGGQFLFTIALARILTPEDFGLLAVAMVLVAFLGLFQDAGFKPALVQRPELDDALTGAVFWGSMALGVMWCVVVLMVAPLWASLYGDPRLTSLLRVLAGLFVLRSLAVVPEALLVRSMAFRRLFSVQIFPSLASGVVSICLAWTGHGVWSLVAGVVTADVLRIAGLWAHVGWRPGAPKRGANWAHLLRFGGWVTLEGLLGWVISYSDQALAGRFLGARQLGFYRMGFSLSMMPVSALSQALGRVLFPAFSRRQHNPEALRISYQQCVRVLSVAVAPVGVGLAVWADPLVPLLLGDRWLETIPVLRSLALVGPLSAMVGLAPPLYRAIGRADIMPRFFMVRAAVSVPAYAYGAMQGVVFLALTHLVLVLCFVPINLYIASRVLGSSYRQILVAIGVAFGVAAASALVVAGIGSAWIPAGPAWRAVPELILFGLCYLALLGVLDRPRLLEVADIVRRIGGWASRPG